MANRYWVGGNGTWNVTTNWSASSNGSGGASVPTAADDVFFDASSDGAGNAAFTVTLTGAATCLSLNFSAVDQNVTFSGAFTLSVLGNLLLSPTRTISVTGITSLAMTATTSRTITAGGGTLTGGITFNSTTGTWVLQDALTVTGTVTHTAGTISLNGFTFTTPAYSNSSVSTRGLNFTTAGSKFSINATTTSTVWTLSSTTALTITSPSTSSVEIIGSSAITRTINNVNTAAAPINFSFLTSAGTITTTASNTFNNLTINCSGTTISNIANTIYGSYSYLAGTLSAGANILTLAPPTGTTCTLTATGASSLDFPISMTGVGTVSLASNVSMGTATSRTFIHQFGTLQLNSYTLTVYGVFNSSQTSTRAINFGTGYIDLTLAGSTTTTIWDSTTVTALTVTNAATGAVRVKGAGTLIRNINTGGLSEANSISFEFLTTAGTITLTNATSRIENLTINCSGTTVSNAAIACYGNYTYTAGTLSAGTNTLSFSATSGVQTISSSGTLDFPITFAGTATYSLSSNVSVGTTTSRLINLTTGTLELNSYTLTLFGQFNPTGTGVRRIQMSGSGGKIVLSIDTGVTVYNNGTVTNFTTDGNVLIQLTGGGAAATKTITAGTGTEAQALSFQLSTTAGTVTFSGSPTIKNLTVANNSFTLSNSTITLYGNLLISGTNPTLTAGANAWTFAATSGTKTITTSGEALDFPLTFNGVGGTWALQDALTVGTSTSRTVTLTAGTIELNSYAFTIFGPFSSSNSNTRRIQRSGSGGKIVTSLNTLATVWDTGTVTGLTTDGNVLVQLTGGGAVVKTINSGALSESNAISFQLSTTAGTVDFTASNTIKNLTIDNNSFTLSNIVITIYGSLTISGTSPTLTAGANAWTFAATSGTKTITTSSETLDFPLTFNGAGGTWQLQDALTMGSTRTLTFNAGTIDLNIKTLTTSIFSIASGGTKDIAVNGGQIYITGSGTAWNNSDGANFTTTTGISYGLLYFTSASAKTFAGGGDTYQFDIIQAGAGALTITGGNTFRDIYTNTLPTTITLQAGVQNTTILFSLTGTSAANKVTLNSDTPGTQAQLYRPPFMGDVTTSYMDIKDINAQGVVWNALYSTNSGNNSGWVFASLSTGNFFLMF